MNRNIIAILRGITPGEASDVGEAILDAGISNIEVPLNSPQAFESIEILASQFADEALIGAGTVLTVDEARTVRKAGGEFVSCADRGCSTGTTARKLRGGKRC